MIEEPNAQTTAPPNAAHPAYAELAKIVLSTQSLSTTLSRVANLTSTLIPEAAEVSVTLIDHDRPRTVAFSGRLAAALDERQYENWNGPCMDAALSGEIIVISDMTDDRLYPEFSRQALRAGIRTSLSIGLPTLVQGTRGALNIYGSGDPFDQADVDAAVGFASYAAVAVTNAAVFAGALVETQQLQEAMSSRAVIEQAKGIVMGQYRCSADAAFTHLRSASNRDNIKLRDVAQRLVDSMID